MGRVIRAYKFLMRPTMGQQAALGEMLRDHCSLYNGALQERRDAYRHTSRTSITYGQQSAQLKEIRAFDSECQSRWSFSSQQATLRRLDKAFAAFFRRVKAGQAPGYPRFRGVNWFDTVDFPKDGDGCRWNSTPHDPVTRVRFQGVGHVKVNQHRQVAGKVKTVSVKREGGRWYVVLTAEQTQPDPMPATGSVVGIDMGIASFLTTSSGEHVPNPATAARPPRNSKPHSRPSPGSPVSAGTSAPATTNGPSRRLPACTARSDAGVSTTPTRPRSISCENTTSSRTRTSTSATWSRPPRRSRTPNSRAASCPTGPARRVGSTTRSRMPDGGVPDDPARQG
ncbi:hypothetical protein SHKM778_65510 [Streptomyces sp. KM77-8]|uniref:Transposase putative helix-turn-helix domain-containing protein n=1 Tax=Streptomyces haneummycinicus TaxID=3074435 RepID=A0AAT9HRI6_9ACTN